MIRACSRRPVLLFCWLHVFRPHSKRNQVRFSDSSIQFSSRLAVACVYRKLKSDYNGDEVHQGWRVNK
jgi:hypothetical protein